MMVSLEIETGLSKVLFLLRSLVVNLSFTKVFFQGNIKMRKSVEILVLVKEMPIISEVTGHRQVVRAGL